MAEIYETRIKAELIANFTKANIKYGISLGRRQPMHIVHLDCIKEIVNAGLHPVIIVGSVNSVDSNFYDPIKNPLTIEQQYAQIAQTLEKAQINKFTVASLADYGDNEKWALAISDALKKLGINPIEAIFHYRKKLNDKEQFDKIIMPLSEYEKFILAKNISIWRSENSNIIFDKISSTPFRMLDLEGAEFKQQKENLTVPDFIVNQVKISRERNQKYLEDLPLTMLDLSFDRAIREAKLLPNKKLQSVLELRSFLSDKKL